MMNDMQEVSRGWYFPISLIRLFEEGVINASELMLLGKINSLCDPKKGCWATNKWLAKWWGKNAHWVSRTINRFSELGLIKIKVRDRNKRVIKVKFNGDQFSGRGGHFTDQRRSLKRSGVVSKVGGLHTYTNNINEGNNSRESEFASSPSIFPGDVEDPFLSKCSARLETFIRLSRKIHVRFKRHTWISEFRQLLKALNGNKQRLKRVLSIYLKEPHDEFTPQAECARSFRLKFARIERWTEEHSNGEIVDSVSERKLPNGNTEVFVQYRNED